MAIFSDDDQLKPKKPENKAETHHLPAKSKDLERASTDFDKSFENNIRPKKFDEYIGQSALKDTLKISIEAAKETRGILTVEDHNVLGGLGGAVTEVVTEYSPAKVLRMGLQDVFGRSGSPVSLYEMFRLTPADIAENAEKLLG